MKRYVRSAVEAAIQALPNNVYQFKVEYVMDQGLQVEFHIKDDDMIGMPIPAEEEDDDN